MKPKSVSVHHGLYLDKQYVTLTIYGATKNCCKHVQITPNEAIQLAQKLLDDVLRLQREKFINMGMD